jgi:hypothetical protein
MGALMIAAPFLATFAWIACTDGLGTALITFGATLFLASWVVVGVALMVGGLR